MVTFLHGVAGSVWDDKLVGADGTVGLEVRQRLVECSLHYRQVLTEVWFGPAINYLTWRSADWELGVGHVMWDYLYIHFPYTNFPIPRHENLGETNTLLQGCYILMNLFDNNSN